MCAMWFKKNHHLTVLANPQFLHWRQFGQNPETIRFLYLQRCRTSGAVCSYSTFIIQYSSFIIRHFDISSFEIHNSTFRYFNIRQFDNSTIRQFDNSTFDNSTFRQFDSSTLRRFDNSTIRHSTIRHFDNSTLRRFDNSSFDNSTFHHSTIRQFVIQHSSFDKQLPNKNPPPSK